MDICIIWIYMYYTPYNAQAIIIILYVNQQKSVHIYHIIYL